MRFRVGPKPYATDFDPTGWTEIRLSRRNGRVALEGLIIGLLVTVGLLVLSWMAIPRSLSLRGFSYWQLALIFCFTVPVHELVHALLQPGLGRETTFGFWPKRLVFYAFYPGPRSRELIIVGALGPFVALSLIPLVTAALLDVQWWGIMALVLINGGASSNDLLGFIFVWRNVPKGAEIMAQSGKGYFRVAPASDGRTTK